MKKLNIIMAVFLIGLIFVYGCTPTKNLAADSSTENKPMEDSAEMEDNVEPEEIPEVVEQKPDQTQSANDWRNIELKDVATGETFRISDFKGKPILLESFAVWCPTCTKQQNEIKKLHEELGDSVISIGLDTDPNEDESKVQEHIDRNGFDWYYAIAPVELTQALIEEFGIGFVNAPSAPVVLIDEDQSTRYLDRGVKSVEKLKEEIMRGS